MKLRIKPKSKKLIKKIKLNSKHLMLAAIIVGLAGLGGVAIVRAALVTPYGTLRGVVAVIGDNNTIMGSRVMDMTITPSQAGYTPIMLAANGAAIRWNGCQGSPCADPTASNYWALRIPQTLSRVKPDAYVIELGINDAKSLGTATTPGYGAYSLKIDYLMKLLPAGKPVIWTNLPCSIERAPVQPGCISVNAALALAPSRWPNLTVANWATAAQGHPEYMAFSGTVDYYSSDGQQAYSNFITSALNAKLPLN